MVEKHLTGSRPVGRKLVRPAFLFVGTGRAGSNWAFEILNEHPSVVLPKNKGTFYFNRNFDRGVRWYESFFRSNGSNGVAGEVCEDYLSDVDAIARIYEYRHDMRIICCLRNPYERAISHWKFFDRNGVAEETLIEQGRRRPDLYYLGFYATQLQVLLKLFPKNQVLVYLYDDLIADPETVVSSIYRFIGVDQNFVPRSTRVLVNAGAEPRVRVVARIVHEVHMHSWGRSRLVSNFTGTVKRFRLLRDSLKVALYKKPRRAGDWLGSLSQFPSDILLRYDREILELENLLERNLSHWKAPAVIIRAARMDCTDAPAMGAVSKLHAPTARP